MNSLARRVDRIEEQCRTDENIEGVEVDLGNGLWWRPSSGVRSLNDPRIALGLARDGADIEGARREHSSARRAHHE